jgi:nucleoside-triphosphatase
MQVHKIVLTGPPGCGKTTAVMTIVEALGTARLAGFYTQEIRERGRRAGFRWHRLDGRTGVLACIDVKSRHRVGKYGVDIESFDREAVPVLDPPAAGVKLFVVDEIGRMECFSERFVEAVHRLLDSDRCVLAVVALKGGGLISEVKSRPGIELLHLTTENRNEIARQTADKLAASMR